MPCDMNNVQHKSRTYLAGLVPLLLAACLAAGCGVRRPSDAPIPLTPPAWEEPAPQSADVEALSRWWESFGDDQMTSLIQRGIEWNLDVRTALSRLREARASVSSARASLQPTVDASAAVRANGLTNGDSPTITSRSC